jgi:anti-sigma-K factor RskA
VTPRSALSERERALLEAYRDGELSRLARFRVERWLRRDADARLALAEGEALAQALRELDAEAPTPDLWPAIRLRLAAADARAAEAARPPLWRSAAGYLALGAAATAATALALLLRSAEPPASLPGPAGSVRWIDARGNPMMVLRDDRVATIIWVPEGES